MLKTEEPHRRTLRNDDTLPAASSSIKKTALFISSKSNSLLFFRCDSDEAPFSFKYLFAFSLNGLQKALFRGNNALGEEKYFFGHFIDLGQK
jgi:hypothetical protein